MTIILQPEDLRSIATSAMDFELATALPDAPLLMPTQVLERAQARQSFRGRHAAIPISLGATTR